MPFCLAGAAPCDIPTCLITCWKSFLYDRRSIFHQMNCTFRELHTILGIFVVILRGRRSTPDSTLYPSHFTLHTLHSTLYTPHLTLHNTPHSTLGTLHSTPCTPHATLHALHSSHCTFTPDTLHSTLNATLCTPHTTLHATLNVVEFPLSPAPHSKSARRGILWGPAAGDFSLYWSFPSVTNKFFLGSWYFFPNYWYFLFRATYSFLCGFFTAFLGACLIKKTKYPTHFSSSHPISQCW